MRQANCETLVFLVASLAVAVAGCGGGGSSTGGIKTDPPPTPTITVGLTCASPAVNAGGTLQCSSTTTPAGSAVSLTASAGTITPAGDFTAPAVTSGDSMPVTITATAAADPSASPATITVTVNRVIAWGPFVPYIYWPPTRAGYLGLATQASGLLVGDQILVAPTKLGILDFGVPLQEAGTVGLTFAMGSQSISPGFLTISATSADGSVVSNALHTVLTSAANALAVCADRIVIADEAEGLPEGQDGVIWEYQFDGTPITSFRAGDFTGAAGCDKASGDIIANGGAYTPSGTIASALGNISEDPDGDEGYSPSETVPGDGNFCELMYQGFTGCGGPVAAPIPSFTRVATGTTPVSIAMADASDTAQVYAADSNDLWWVNAPAATVQASTSLAGIVTAQATLQPGQGGWPGLVFGSGNRAGYSALLSIPDQKLVVALGGAVTSTINLTPLAPAPGAVAIMAIADEPLGTIIVGFADDTAEVGRFVMIDPMTGVVTQLGVTSVSAPVGMGVSADGATLYVGSRDQPPDILTISQ